MTAEEAGALSVGAAVVVTWFGGASVKYGDNVVRVLPPGTLGRVVRFLPGRVGGRNMARNVAPKLVLRFYNDGSGYAEAPVDIHFLGAVSPA